MTSPQGMDDLFQRQDHGDVNDWAERLTMAAKVQDLNVDKLFEPKREGQRMVQQVESYMY